MTSVNRHIVPDRNDISNTLRRSDHWPFLQNDVPALWFFTGFHPEYHTENDVAERINYEKLQRVVRLIHQTSWNLAQTEARPRMNADQVTAPTP